MTISIGNYSLAAAVLTAVAAIIAALGSVRLDSPSLLRASRWLIAAVAVLISISSAALMAAILQSDFRVAYVASYTERALPTGYKLAAFWAGQEGSLMLWAWLLAVMGAIAVWQRRRDEGLEPAATFVALAVVTGFFAALMLYAANPFKVLTVVPADGRGLNPLLQDPGMIAHPPLLFVGYAGFTIPFAMMVGALVAGRRDSQWIDPMRRWLVVSWLFLSAGILLGAQWAYVELGWGGYWAWDPVENASLLPWLTATALLHSIMIQHQRGMFKRWNAVLIAATFILCILGTYLTRSGVIQSVHSFGDAAVGTFFLTLLRMPALDRLVAVLGGVIGTFFLVFLGIVTLATAALLVLRRRELKSEHRVEHLMSKDGFFLAVNILLVIIMMVTLIGTIFPLISTVVIGEQVSVGPPFYNKVILPMALLLVALMAVGPLLTYGRDAGVKIMRRLPLPLCIAMTCVLVMVLLKVLDLWALTCGALAALTICVVVDDLVRIWLRRMSDHHEGALTALVRLIGANHRRYGAQLAHLGIILIVVGVAGSSLFGVEETLQVRPGESRTVGRYALTFKHVHETRGANFTAVEAHVTLTNGRGTATNLRPQMRRYDKSEQDNAEVALRSTLIDDVYLTLVGVSEGGNHVAIKAIVNPLVIWIWIGGVVLSLGGIVCLLPRLLPRTQHAQASHRASADKALAVPGSTT